MEQWALLYLLLIGMIASVSGVWQALLATVLAFLALNFFFLPPYHSLWITEAKDVLALAVFLVVGVTLGILAGRSRDREGRALARERETALLNRLSAHLVSLADPSAMAAALLEEMTILMEGQSAALFLPTAQRETVTCAYRYPANTDIDPLTNRLAKWSFQYKCAIGVPTLTPRQKAQLDNWPASKTYAQLADGKQHGDLFVPLQSNTQCIGILYLGERIDRRPYSANKVRALLAIANLATAFLERAQMQAAVSRHEALLEADRLKSTLISSVSHELKTPLAAVTATVTSLLEDDVSWDVPMMRQELLTVRDDLNRLHDSIGALLDFSRLEANAWHPQHDWYEFGEIIGSVLAKFPAEVSQRFAFAIPDDLPLLYVDFQQIARALQHLIENALTYSPQHAPIELGAAHAGAHCKLWVQDRGPGIPEEERRRIFEKFYRGSAAGSSPSGTGLGLAITAEIVRFHEGRIWVEEAKPYGARFVISLPSHSHPTEHAHATA